MEYDVSVLIPACDAEPFIARAIESVRRQHGIFAEIIIAADDHRDYLACLAAQGIDRAHILQCRTARPRSGPGPARNLAATHAQAPIIATLDADDEYCDGRLARLVPAAWRHGVATGATMEMLEGELQRVGRPSAGDALTLDDICRLRMPFCPVFRRDLLGRGWPDLAFAEDMVFNARLATKVERYAFVENAAYLYHRRDGSLTEDGATLERALSGYRQILAYLEEGDWPAAARATLCDTIEEDIAMVEAARVRGGSSWREAWSRWQAHAAGASVPSKGGANPA